MSCRLARQPAITLAAKAAWRKVLTRTSPGLLEACAKERAILVAMKPQTIQLHICPAQRVTAILCAVKLSNSVDAALCQMALHLSELRDGVYGHPIHDTPFGIVRVCDSVSAMTIRTRV